MKYLLALAFLILGFAAVSEAGALKPFVSDGCSSSPDGFVPGVELLECCLAHDVEYWKGGTFEEKEKADADFKMCLDKKTLPVIADAYYESVKVGGLTELKAPWAWGYGWAPLRDYAPLTEGEKREVQEKHPNFSIPLPLVKTYELEEPRIALIKFNLKLKHGFTPSDVSSIYRVVEMNRGKMNAVADVPSDNKYFQAMSDACPQGFYLVDATDFFTKGTMSVHAYGSCPKLPTYTTTLSIKWDFSNK
ncbi:hypothetical protein [Bdellovibrio sp. HCB337]|uniref:hypothetical protein n=1 Tax=Bdellovibrio sp. HCB337 TaxID=3394358 RepID=UPI0039A6655E